MLSNLSLESALSATELDKTHPTPLANTFTLAASEDRSSSSTFVSSETTQPLLLPSLNESSSNALPNQESAIASEEDQQPRPKTASTNPIEYMQTKDISIGSSIDGTPIKGR